MALGLVFIHMAFLHSVAAPIRSSSASPAARRGTFELPHALVELGDRGVLFSRIGLQRLDARVLFRYRGPELVYRGHFVVLG